MDKSFQKKTDRLASWKPPKNRIRIKVIDAHTEGEPFRVITEGFPEIPGNTILQKRRYLKENLDHLRTALMWEPRGHADMYGCIITPPVTKEADFGVLFMHNEGYSTMCGHGIIGITKIILETGMFPASEPQTEIKIDTPAGLVTAFAKIKNKNVQSVHFRNVPSFVQVLDEKVNVPGIGKLSVDIAFGGAFYAYVNADEAGVKCTPDNFRLLIARGMAIKEAVMEKIPLKHPFEEDLNFLYGTIFIDEPLSKGSQSRNVCIFAEGEVDRSPTGTGVSGRLAIHYAKNEIKTNQQITIESIIGTLFKGKIIKTTGFGPYQAVIPEIEGNAFITGINEFYLDPDDPLKHGFILR